MCLGIYPFTFSWVLARHSSPTRGVMTLWVGLDPAPSPGSGNVHGCIMHYRRLGNKLIKAAFGTGG